MDRSTVVTLLSSPISNGARLTWLLLPPKEAISVKALAKELRCTEREVRRRVDELVQAKLAAKTTVADRSANFYYTQHINAVMRLPLQGADGTVQPSPATAGPNSPLASPAHPSTVKRTGVSNANLPKLPKTKRQLAIRPSTKKAAKKKKAR
jgi:hypothetical protein